MDKKPILFHFIFCALLFIPRYSNSSAQGKFDISNPWLSVYVVDGGIVVNQLREHMSEQEIYFFSKLSAFRK